MSEQNVHQTIAERQRRHRRAEIENLGLDRARLAWLQDGDTDAAVAILAETADRMRRLDESA